MGIQIRSGSRLALLAVTSAAAIIANVAAPVAAHHDLYRRVSAGSLSIGGNGAFPVGFAGASTDGKRVFFSSAEQLTTNDDDSEYDVFVRAYGSTFLQSVGEINGDGPFGATFAGTSADGSRVFFQTAEQLVSTDTDSAIDVYQRSDSATTLVSAGAINGNGTWPATFAGASADGTRVWFHTIEKLVAADTDISKDVYERVGNTTTLVSVGQINGNSELDTAFAGATAGGGRVWFTTTEKLVPADIDTALDIYERSSGLTFRVSRGVINGNGNFTAGFRGASSDGSRVFFVSNEQLVSTDTDTQADIYEFSAGTVQQISAGAINGNGAHPAVFAGYSSDGSSVFFETTEKLVNADTDGSTDIYRRAGGVTSLLSAGAINGNGAHYAGFRGASADGLRVFFVTYEKLVSADTDASLDVYERYAGSTYRLSRGQINSNGAFNAEFLGTSADGSRVFFSTAEQLASTDADPYTDIYEHKYGGSFTVFAVSIGNGNIAVTFRGCSADGLAVFFTTTEKILPSDTDVYTDIYGAYDADI